MTITYCRNDPVSGRWSGVDRLLTEFEVDYNFYQHDTRIATLETNYTLTISIASVTQPAPDQLLITMTDASSQGPFTLPSATFTDTGAWAPSTPYLVNDTFTANGSLYRVLFAHTSASTFSPTANDGAGHDYYAAMMSSPGNALPSGGATAQVLQKSTSSDYAVMWGYKLPTGGTSNQVLLKQSATNQDAAWTTLGATLVSFTPSTGSALTSTNVADAIEEVEANAAALTLADLTDVAYDTAGPTTGQVLRWNGAFWSNAVVTVTMSDISDIVLTSAASGDLMSFDGTDWVNIAQSMLALSFTQISGDLTVSQLRNTTMTALGTTGSVALDPTLGNIFTITPTGDLTITASSVPAGAEITIVVTTSGTTSRTITFSSGTFKSQGTLATGIVSGKFFAIKFVGTSSPNWLVEVSRTTAM